MYGYLWTEVREMAGQNPRQTSAKTATAANNVLRKPKGSGAAKPAVASALSRTPKCRTE